jgi:hypothetical protein
MRMSKRTTQIVTGDERYQHDVRTVTGFESEQLEQSVGDNTYENIRSRRDVQHTTTADGLVSVLIDDMVVYLHVMDNDTLFLSAIFPWWSIDIFTIRGPLLVAPFPVFRLLFCKYPPLTLFIIQGTLEDGDVITV